MTCLLCGEEFDDPNETVLPVNGGAAAAHQACLMRCVVGGLNHQRGTCTCCGGKDTPDPPSLSRREAGRVAFMHWRMKLRRSPNWS